MVSAGTCAQHRSLVSCRQTTQPLRCTCRGARKAFGDQTALAQLCRLRANSKGAALVSRAQGRSASRVVAATAEEEITLEEDTMEKMEKSLESVTGNFASLRTGRANPAMLDRVKVDYYGAPTPLKTLAGISAPESTLLVIQPYDKTALPAIEKAIMQSDIGATPNSDGNLIRISIPALTADRRKEMTKSVSRLAEDGKVSIRNVRRASMKQLDKHEKDGDVSEDEKKGLADSIQELTDNYVKEIEKLAKSKQDELIKI